VVAFYGAMGAGKTTLIKAICAAMGITGTVNSPTFALVNEYRKPSGEPVYHFDFYRINKPEEAFDLGYEEYFFSGHSCLVEWPELIAPLLPPDTLHLHLHVGKEGKRTISSD
jgi:tRNA threonylcarbamoyladenosine biosynthesis protein TsaE